MQISRYPGERLGLPEHGPGSVARVGRRLLAVAVDWALSMLVSYAFFASDAFATLAAFGVVQVVLVGTAGTSFGHRLLGLQVVRVDGGAPGPGRAALRGLLLCLALPALVWDSDQRGVHDQVARTVLLRR